MKESVQAYSKQKSIVKKALKTAGFENIKISNGYYYFSGFATKNNKVIYFSISDVRHFPPTGGGADLLIRTAKDYKDYTGGSNNFTGLDIPDIQQLANYLTKKEGYAKGGKTKSLHDLVWTGTTAGWGSQKGNLPITTKIPTTFSEEEIEKAIDHYNDRNLEWIISEDFEKSDDEKYWIITGWNDEDTYAKGGKLSSKFKGTKTKSAKFLKEFLNYLETSKEKSLTKKLQTTGPNSASEIVYAHYSSPISDEDIDDIDDALSFVVFEDGPYKDGDNMSETEKRELQTWLDTNSNVQLRDEIYKFLLKERKEGLQYEIGDLTAQIEGLSGREHDRHELVDLEAELSTLHQDYLAEYGEEYAKGGEVKKKGTEMIIGGLAGVLLGIFLNK